MAEIDIAKLSALSQPGPYGVDLEAGKTYYYCRCGLSKSQPFCDGSHRKLDNGITPQAFVAEETKKHWLCGCRQSDSLPFCDGAHKKEKGIKKYNEFLLRRNTEMKDELEKVNEKVMLRLFLIIDYQNLWIC
jgi:CDGSH iron-sulfur domain-containing protein 3